MASGKLNLTEDLPFGTLNPLEDKNVAHSGDRRRTSSLNALNAATSRAYGVSTLQTIQRFKGIIVNRRVITMPRYSNRMDLLQGYVATNLEGTSDAGAVQSRTSGGRDDPYRSPGRVAYKVYIPELEPRPAPKNAEDPVIKTYPDIFTVAGRNDLLALPIGAVVDVEYEDRHRLFGPKIVEGSNQDFVLLDGFGKIQADLASQFKGATASALGDGSGPTPLPGTPPVPGADAPLVTAMSQAAVDKKRKAEGVVLELYNDPLNYCTVGIGHLVGGLKPCHELEAAGQIPAEWLKGGVPPDGKNNRAPAPTLTQAEAEALFDQDIKKREKKLVQMLRAANNVKVTQNQFDALMSAVYNAGEGNVNKYIIKPYLAQTPPDYKGAAEAFTVYGQMGYLRRGEEKYLAGVNRLRERERSLFYQA
tara:strand:- start:91027 stop:92283 length:1257 start_codon:yes stop_codon:yes gene_type:complete